MSFSNVIVTILVVILMFVGFRTALMYPEVHISYTTNECVRVIQSNGIESSCTHLPEKYIQVWVR